MYIHYCSAYEDIEVKVESLDEHVNLSIRSTKSGNTVSVTLCGEQVRVVASALVEILSVLGEVEDRLSLFGSAVKIGNKTETHKEAA